MTVDEVLAELANLGSERNRQGMSRFGINIERAYGVSVGEIRKLGKRTRRDHKLALALWATGKHEARILASIIADPLQVTVRLMNTWIRDFDSWDLCDQCCGNLFIQTPYAWKKAVEWTRRKAEFEKRAGFALMAHLASHAKNAPDERFLAFFPLIERADDDRNFVRKAVSWALRGIGKRNERLRAAAVVTARQMLSGTRSQRWVARDALLELTSKPA
jgi:3-methyladenine DNA glycosylase AlkD